MIFSYQWLQSFFKKKLPQPKKLADLLTIHSFEVGEIKKVGKDFVLDIEVLPNRAPDCFSHLGLAREIAVLTGQKLQIPELKLKENKVPKAKDLLSVKVKDKIACPRYTARVITEVKVGPSPKWIKERLKVCGLRPINNIVDISNLVMLETGQPLHAFDGQKLNGPKIIVRFAKPGEKITTLDGEKYNLDKDILVIADSKHPVAIAGIKGGKIPEIDKKTKMVVLEAANFDPRAIRRGSKKLNLKTDASWRFEHGIDPNLTELAINRAASLIQEIAKGKAAQGLIDFYPQKIFPKRIKLDLDYVRALLGIKISDSAMIKILEDLGFRTKRLKDKKLEVKVPTWRLDVYLPEDLIEEIGRIYGFRKIPSVFPQVCLVPPKRNLDVFWEDLVKNILKETGFSEVYNYSFFGEREAKIFGFFSDDLIEIENPISLKLKYLRRSLIPNLLNNIKENLKYFKQIKIFEIGKIYQKIIKKSSQVIFREKKALTGAIVKKEPGIDSFYQVKGIIDLLLRKLGIGKIWYDFYQPTPQESKILIWHPKKCAEIKINGTEIGFLGEISPSVLEELKIEEKVILFDIDFEKLIKFASEEHEFWPISKYPAAIRDLAILVPRGVLVVEVLNKINTVGGPLVRDVDLFDIYEGDKIPQGMKSLAFHIVYQAQDRTLSSKEIEKIHNKIITALEENPEWQVRK